MDSYWRLFGERHGRKGFSTRQPCLQLWRQPVSLCCGYRNRQYYYQRKPSGSCVAKLGAQMLAFDLKEELKFANYAGRHTWHGNDVCTELRRTFAPSYWYLPAKGLLLNVTADPLFVLLPPLNLSRKTKPSWPLKPSSN